ncbi:outer membrane protein, partial [Methylobacterium iners]|uniref:outer membrane protein n=1 Tax=Methylobacterium iners TaxID=418707 RepID=UPI00362419B2
PRRAAPPVFVPVPVFTWTGFYAGFNAGYGFDAGSNSNVYGIPAGTLLNSAGTAGTLTLNRSNQGDGFVGGAQIGYNYQFTPGSGLVVGIEADAQYADFGGQRRSATGDYTFVGAPGLAFAAPPAFVVPAQATLDYFGTVRGRVGYAFDRVLFYGTGGFAYGSGESAVNGLSNDSFRTGFAAGGGVEYALPTDSFLNFFRSSAVTLKVEGLYVNLERNRTNATGIFAAGVNPPNGTVFLANQREQEFVVVRAGLNYKFGSY